VEDISAGLSISVVKNAIYKVIRAGSADELGSHIVVQGGTFLNDAILRSFEREINREVTRPNIAGLMGAFGAALYAKSLGLSQSGMIGAEELASFSHRSRTMLFAGCATIGAILRSICLTTGADSFRATGANARWGNVKNADIPNMIAFKNERIQSLVSSPGPLGKIGIPLGLICMRISFSGIGF
jgi:hypothetical protein